MKKFMNYIPFAIILATTILLFIRVNQDGKKSADVLLYSSAMVGRQITDVSLPSLYPANGKIDGATYGSGKYTLVNLFASWCAACVAEHPLLSGLKDKDLQMLGIAWRDKPEDTQDWLGKNGNPYDLVAMDELGKYGIMLGVTGIPETFLVNGQGVIIMHIRGTLMEQDIKAIIKELKSSK